jgi:hypothetical protein
VGVADWVPMELGPADHRHRIERRVRSERRTGLDRRITERRVKTTRVTIERRLSTRRGPIARRAVTPRRVKKDRRGSGISLSDFNPS